MQEDGVVRVVEVGEDSEELRVDVPRDGGEIGGEFAACFRGGGRGEDGGKRSGGWWSRGRASGGRKKEERVSDGARGVRKATDRLW